uniref:Uncharacterized protein n=1 Tax=Octopus bimaculoides TaxID=37653 RepID=A0A0L8GK91_OCTBM
MASYSRDKELIETKRRSEDSSSNRTRQQCHGWAGSGGGGTGCLCVYVSPTLAPIKLPYYFLGFRELLPRNKTKNLHYEYVFLSLHPKIPKEIHKDLEVLHLLKNMFFFFFLLYL